MANEVIPHHAEPTEWLGSYQPCSSFIGAKSNPAWHAVPHEILCPEFGRCDLALGANSMVSGMCWSESCSHEAMIAMSDTHTLYQHLSLSTLACIYACVPVRGSQCAGTMCSRLDFHKETQSPRSPRNSWPKATSLLPKFGCVHLLLVRCWQNLCAEDR